MVALATGVLAVAVVGGVAFGGWVASVVEETPDIRSLRPKPAGAVSTVYAADGTRLGFITADILRTPIPGNRIPQVMKEATVAIEDRRFYRHRGVDYVGVVRAALTNLAEDRTAQGGSTLTMQLVRNLYIPEDRFERSLTRKIREAKLADELERQHSKQWILTSYLNNVPFGTVGGQEAIGVQAAARVFFDKPAARLTLPEAALLAGLPQAPSQYNPFLNPEAARRRRNAVLRAMVEAGYITRAEADAAAQAPLGVKKNAYYQQRKEPFVFDYVRDQLIRRYGREVVRAGGLKVYTSIDLRKQEAARAAIANQLSGPDDPSAAVVTVDPANGHIVAMASSEKYGDADEGGTNYNFAAQAQRQPGSTFKTMVLMAALRQGVDPDTTYYVSRPLTAGWNPQYPSYAVKTYGNTYSGAITVTRATLGSDNAVYAQLAADVGPDEVRRAAYDMGITSRLHGYLAESLGGLEYGVTPLEMASAYATIANGGIRIAPTAILRVVHRDGRVDDWTRRMRRKRTFTAAETGEARRVLEMVTTSGTGTNARYGCPIAGKTGTTNDNKDAWFVGFSPRLSTAVWIGYPQPRTMYAVRGIGVQGGTIPAMIWRDYMSVARGDDCAADWPEAPPFQGTAFTGTYTSGPPTADDETTDAGETETDETTDSVDDGDAGAGGGEGNPDRDAYARPPQGEPPVPVPPAGSGGGGGAPAGGGAAPNG